MKKRPMMNCPTPPFSLKEKFPLGSAVRYYGRRCIVIDHLGDILALQEEDKSTVRTKWTKVVPMKFDSEWAKEMWSNVILTKGFGRIPRALKGGNRSEKLTLEECMFLDHIVERMFQIPWEILEKNGGAFYCTTRSLLGETGATECTQRRLFKQLTNKKVLKTTMKRGAKRVAGGRRKAYSHRMIEIDFAQVLRIARRERKYVKNHEVRGGEIPAPLLEDFLD